MLVFEQTYFMLRGRGEPFEMRWDHWDVKSSRYCKFTAECTGERIALIGN